MLTVLIVTCAVLCERRGAENRDRVHIRGEKNSVTYISYGPIRSVEYKSLVIRTCSSHGTSEVSILDRLDLRPLIA
jgi:hypothetical protein